MEDEEEEQFQTVRRIRGRGSRQGNEGPRADGTVEDVQNTINELLSHSDIAQMANWCTTRIDRFLNGNPVSRIILLGNGHFDASWEPGAHQFAFAIVLQRKYAAEILFQEPCCSFAEAQWLSEQDNIIVRKELNLLIPPTRGYEIVIFIHGIHSFLNDLMWFRWDNMDKSIFICNDYSAVDLIGGRRAINDEHEALNVFRTNSTIMKLPPYGPNSNFFSDTSIIFAQGELPEISPDRPSYTESC